MPTQKSRSPFNLYQDVPAAKALFHQIHVYLYAVVPQSSCLILAYMYKRGCDILGLEKQSHLVKRMAQEATGILTQILPLCT